jgi:hypothetical protein
MTNNKEKEKENKLEEALIDIYLSVKIRKQEEVRIIIIFNYH